MKSTGWPDFPCRGQFKRSHGAKYYPSTSNMAVRKEVFEKIQFQTGNQHFNNGFVYDGGREDSQFWRELRRNGFLVTCDPELIAFHHITHERFNKFQITRRAWADGKALWKREQKVLYLEHAIRDVLLWKLKFIENIWGKNHQGWMAEFAKEFLWMIRQAGFIKACAFSSGSNFLFVLREIAVISYRVFISQIKRPIRKALVSLRRRSGKIKPVVKGPKNLLVVCFGFLGDMVLIEPVCRAYKEANPNCRMELLTHKQGEEIHRNNEIWDTIVVLKNRGADAHQLPQGLTIETDAIIIPYFHRDDHGLIDYLTGIAPCVTFNEDVGFIIRRYYEWCSEQVTKNFEKHELDNLTQLFKAVGSVGKLKPTELKFEDFEAKLALEYFDLINSPPEQTILIHFGSKQDNKLWQLDRWEELARRIVEETDYGVLIIGGAEYKKEGERMAAMIGNRIFNTCGRAVTVRQMAAVIDKSALVITGDSSPKHIAIACETPSLTLYGASNPKRWGDYWKRPIHHAILGGCFDLTDEEMYDLPEDHLMRNISVDQVFKKFLEISESKTPA